MILVDAGPLVALVDASHADHARCVFALKEVAEPLATVWPAVAEALGRLAGAPDGQVAVLEMLRRRAVRLLPLGDDDVPRLQELVARRRDLTLAQAALVRVSERDGLDRVFTLEGRRLEGRRAAGRRGLRVLPGPRKSLGAGYGARRGKDVTARGGRGGARASR